MFERNGEQVSYPVQSRISANEATVLMQVALAGVGIALLPTYLVVQYIRSGALIALLPDLSCRRVGDLRRLCISQAYASGTANDVGFLG